MRDFTQKRLSELLDTLLEVHEVLLSNDEGDVKLNLLADCQEAMDSVAQSLRDSGVDESVYGATMEDYFRVTFQASQNIGDVGAFVPELNAQVYALKEVVKNTEITYHILFLPYKASMWDSLESIWKACVKDERCHCQVVSLPYYQMSETLEQGTLMDERDLYPDDVNIIGHEAYSLRKDLPDVVYVHNPYDGYNRITQVMPEYFSDNIKKYANKLVYVPYYLTGGQASKEHLNLSVYRHMDYMIAQSSTFKEHFETTPYRDKLLPYGSPKVDKLIEQCHKIHGSSKEKEVKSVFLNTSIYIVLRDGEQLIKKLKHVFDVFKNRKDVRLVWRPHPLIKGTLSSMAPTLLRAYERLEKYFIDEKVGTLDTSPDVTQTVCEAEAYIGEESSSLVNYFQVLGKPIFLLNNLIVSSDVSWKVVRFLDGQVTGDKLWLTSCDYNAIFKMDLTSQDVHLIEKFPEHLMWEQATLRMGSKNDTFFLAQRFSKSFVIYNKADGYQRTTKVNDTQFTCSNVVSYGNKVFYVPSLGTKIVEYDLAVKKVITHDCSVHEMCEKMSSWSSVAVGNKLWVTFLNTNLLLIFDMDNHAHTFLEIGGKENAYVGIAYENGFIWLGETRSGSIYKIDCSGQVIEKIELTEAFDDWHLNDGVTLRHYTLHDMGDYIVTTPGTSNLMVKVHKRSGVAQTIMKDFWKASGDIHNGYNPGNIIATAIAIKLDDNRLLVQRNHDNKMAIYNVKGDTVQEFLPTLTQESYEKLIANEDGFEKAGRFRPYARKENRLFSLEGFLDDLRDGKLEAVKEKQLSSISECIANPDGGCGEKVHNFMMAKLEEENQ